MIQNHNGQLKQNTYELWLCRYSDGQGVMEDVKRDSRSKCI